MAISRVGGLVILRTEQESELADVVSDEVWCNKVAFLAGISKTLNTLKKSMQGKNETILICTDKINPFQGRQNQKRQQS
jgi:hypothetical protein